MKLYLDDERQMPFGFDIHVKSSDEAVALLATNAVTCISLDHDLGDIGNGTGYDVACFIERSAYEGTLKQLEVTIHSANPIGRARMEQAIAKARQYWNMQNTGG